PRLPLAVCGHEIERRADRAEILGLLAHDAERGVGRIHARLGGLDAAVDDVTVDHVDDAADETEAGADELRPAEAESFLLRTLRDIARGAERVAGLADRIAGALLVLVVLVVLVVLGAHAETSVGTPRARDVPGVVRPSRAKPLPFRPRRRCSPVHPRY